MVIDNNITEKQQVNYQFKILYAIGMIIVVANHGPVTCSIFYEFFPAYSFHM